MARWKQIVGFDNYEISAFGDVRNTGRGKGIKSGRVLKPRATVDGYSAVVLHRHGPKYFLVHRLVALTFHGQCPLNKCYACHRDGTRTNNHWSNLYWATQQDNMNDMVRHGNSTKGRPGPNKGVPCPMERRIRISATLISRNRSRNPSQLLECSSDGLDSCN